MLHSVAFICSLILKGLSYRWVLSTGIILALLLGVSMWRVGSQGSGKVSAGTACIIALALAAVLTGWAALWGGILHYGSIPAFVNALPL